MQEPCDNFNKGKQSGMRQRAKVDANQKQIVNALRKCGYSVLHLHTLGKGAPDIVVGVSGMNYLFEIKSVVGRSYLKDLIIEVTDKGFTVWTHDKVKIKGRGTINQKHWIIDASCVKEDGMIRLGAPDLYKTEARPELENNRIRISRKR